MGLFRPCSAFFGLFFAFVFSANATESIYSIDVANNYLYGEIFHVAAAAKLDPHTYVYLPTVSGVPDPEKSLNALQKTVSIYQSNLAASTGRLDQEIHTAAEWLRTRPRLPGENAVQISFDTPKGPVTTRSEILSADEIWSHIRRGRIPVLPPAAKEKMTELIRRYRTDVELLKKARQWLNAAKKARLFASFLESAGLKDRILPFGLSKIPGDGRAIEGLAGRRLPNGKVLENPVRRFLYRSTQTLVGGLRRDRDGTKKLLKDSFLPETAASDLKEVHEFARSKVISKIPAGAKSRIVWNRLSAFEPERNMSQKTLLKIFEQTKAAGEIPILFGPAIPEEWTLVNQWIAEGKAVNATQHWLDPVFTDPKSGIVRQLELFEYLTAKGGVTSQIGMLGGVMDGISLATDLPTTALTIENPKGSRIGDLAEALGTYQIRQGVELDIVTPSLPCPLEKARTWIAP